MRLAPLVVPCENWQDVVKTLLQRGAGVNSKDKDNITALMEASIMDHRDVVKHLLKVSTPNFIFVSEGLYYFRLASLPSLTMSLLFYVDDRYSGHGR